MLIWDIGCAPFLLLVAAATVGFVVGVITHAEDKR